MDNGIVDPYATHFSVNESKISLKSKKQKNLQTTKSVSCLQDVRDKE